MKIGLKTSFYPYRHFTEHLVDAFEKSPWDSDLNHKTSSFSIRQLKNNTGASPATIHKQHEEVSHQNEWQHLATREPHATSTLAAWAAAEPLVRDNVGADQNDQISDAAVNTQRTGAQEKKKAELGSQAALKTDRRRRGNRPHIQAENQRRVKDFCWTDLLGSTHAQDENQEAQGQIDSRELHYP
jgi:hypothetical protein